MEWKRPSVEEQQRVLHSSFDIETHKQTIPLSCLAVVISPEGVVEYAVPSHIAKLIEIFMKQKGFDDIDKATKYIINTTIDNGMRDIGDFLMGVTGYIAVLFDRYIAGDPPTKQQLDKLKELFNNGVYIGPTWDIITQEQKALEQSMRSLKDLNKGE